MPRENDVEATMDGQDWGTLQEAVARFRAALRRGDCPSVEDYLPAEASRRAAFLVELVHEEIEHRLKAGEAVSVESYRDRFADLRSSSRFDREFGEVASFWRARGRLAGRGDAGASALHGSRYELGEVIGKGACGVVYRAWDTTLGRPVAVKRLRAGTKDDPGVIARFVREAHGGAALRHPAIVPVHDAGEVDGEPYLVCALVDGKNLDDELKSGRPGPRQAAEWVASVADALGYAHQNGLIHRDVKPSNILIDGRRHALLTDFGLAKLVAVEGLSMDGQFIGTPAYMSPEQARGDTRAIDARTDIYSLGVVLYEALTGVRPFQGSGKMLMARIQEEEPTPPHRLDDAIPRDLETVCLKAMAKEPGRRYPDAASLAADLRRWLGGEPVLAHPVGPVGAFWRRCRRKPVVAGLAAALVLAVVAGFAGVTWQWQRAEAQRRLAEANLAAARQQRQRALQILGGGAHALSSLLKLYDQGPDEPGRDRVLLRNAILDYYHGALRGQLAADPESREALSSLAIGVMSLVHRTATRDEALRGWEETQGIFAGLRRDDPTNILYVEIVARCLGNRWALLRDMGRLAEAESKLRESLDWWQVYGSMTRGYPLDDPGHRSARLIWIGARLDLASVGFEIGPEFEWIAYHRQTLEMAEEMLRERPGDETARRLVAETCADMGRRLYLDAPGEGIALYLRACELAEPIAEGHAPDRVRLERWGRFLYELAGLEDRQDRGDEALRDFRRAVATFEGLSRSSPLDPEGRAALGASHHIIGRLLVDMARPAEAIGPYRAAIAIREELLRAEPDGLRWISECAGSWHRLGEAMEALGQPDEAVGAYRKSVVHQRQVCGREPGEVKHRRLLDARLRQLFTLLVALRRSDEAVEAVRERQALSPDDPVVAAGAAVELAAAAVPAWSREAVLVAAIESERRRYVFESLARLRNAARMVAGRLSGGKA